MGAELVGASASASERRHVTIGDESQLLNANVRELVTERKKKFICIREGY